MSARQTLQISPFSCPGKPADGQPTCFPCNPCDRFIRMPHSYLSVNVMLYVDKVLDFKVVLQRKDVELMNLEKEVGQNWCQVSLIRINQCVAGNQFPARARSSFKTMNSPPLLLRLLLLFFLWNIEEKNYYQVDFKKDFYQVGSQSPASFRYWTSKWNYF